MKQKKQMKLSTFSFVIERDGKTVPFESLPLAEQEAYKKKFTQDFMDSIMRAQGYQRKEKLT